MTLPPLDGCGPADPALIYAAGLCTVITIIIYVYLGWKSKKDAEQKSGGTL